MPAKRRPNTAKATLLERVLGLGTSGADKLVLRKVAGNALAGAGNDPLRLKAAESSGFEWHYIDNETFQLIGYITVITCETLTGILLLIGGFTGLFRTRDVMAWAGAQKWTYFGGFLGLGVFFFGFLTVGGNWFIMYLNETWNGMEPAFQNSVMTITMLILVTGVLAGSQIGAALTSKEPVEEAV